MMPIENQLWEIEHFDAGDDRVLTLYVQTDPARDSGRNLRAQLTDLLRPLRAATANDKTAALALERDAAALTNAIAGIVPAARSVVAFACTARAFTHAVPLHYPVAPQVYWEHKPHLTPLLALLDEHERALVVVLDKERLRLFRIFMGAIEQLADFVDEVPGKHREGGFAQQKAGAGHAWSVRMGYASATIQRHHEWHVRKHMDHVLKVLHDAQRSAPVDQILLSAPPEASAEFLHLLPHRWRALVNTDLHVPMFATPAEILEAASAVQQDIERSNEERLVDQLFEMDPGHMAAGAAAVAEAAANREVLTFLYAAGAQLSGAQCATCGWLVPGNATTSCPRCGAAMAAVADLVDVLSTEVLRCGGRVEEVRGSAAERLMRAEGVAALLRFSATVAT